MMHEDVYFPTCGKSMSHKRAGVPSEAFHGIDVFTNR